MITRRWWPSWTLACALGCAATAAAVDDLPEIKQRGRLRVVVAADGMPEAATLEPGAPPGMEREMVQAFADLHRLGIEFVSVAVSGDRFPALKSGDGDVVVGNVGITEDRRKLVAFTHEVFPNRSIAVSWRPYPPILSLEQLRRERVGVIRNSAWSVRAESAGVPRENLDDSYETPDQVLHALRAGKVTAVVMPVDRALVLQRRERDLQLGVFTPPSPGRAWAVRHGSPELLRALNEYISSVRRTPTWSRLAVKYYGDLARDVLKAAEVP